MASLISEIKVEIPAFLREKSTDLETELFFWIKNAFSENFIPSAQNREWLGLG